MAYQVLARKLRPTVFSELVGQEHVVRALTHALDHDRLHHAYLFTGTRGIGKTTVARILARSLNCEQGMSSTPCGKCSICLELLEGRFVDLIEVDAASRTGVDDTRELLDNAQYLPSRGRYKVYLIDEVHMLSKAAFNALLKTLEEPPEHVVFLLATTDPKKLPITVLSRCLQFQLKSLSAAAIGAYLTKVLEAEQVPFDADGVELLAAAARGSMRDALSVTDQAIAHGGGEIRSADVVSMLGTAGRDELAALMQALAAQDAHALLELIGELAERAVDFKELLEALLAEWHRYAVAHATGGAAPAFDAETVQLNYQIALLGLRDLEVIPDQRLGFEMTLLRMLAFAPAAVPAAGSNEPVPGAVGTPPEHSAATTLADARAQTASVGVDAAAVAAPASADSSEPPVALAPSPPVSAVSAAAEAPAEPPPPPDTLPLTIIAGELSERWHALLPQLPLSGVARMLAEHALPISLTATRCELALDAAQDLLLNDVQQQRVRQALSEHSGQAIELTIVLARMDRETPAQRRSREHAERQAAAEQATRSDATVRELINTFGGELRRVTLLEDLGNTESTD
ncbi:MAG: DNA polymerase III subunit gamma/tau [Pseudomonadota bacterium]